MQHISLTPFGGRPVDAAHLAARLAPAPPTALPLGTIDKWSVFDDLRTVRAGFGLTDRDLSVLHALLSFLPAKTLAEGIDLVVFPSNATLSDRAHGMAESTLRRHLAALVAAGVIWRQDSPNGKRYAARDRSGGLMHAFGFDLRPLLRRAGDIAAAAEAARVAALALTRTREALVLRLRDAAKLIAHGREDGIAADWDALDARLAPLRAALRRKADVEILASLLVGADAVLRAVHHAMKLDTEETLVTAAHSGRHHTKSNKESTEFEPCLEKGRAGGGDDPSIPPIPLGLVLKACPDILPYARGGIATWRDLVATAGLVRGMMGISAQAWEEAVRIMGIEVAAVTVAAMLQRIALITNPGGYLRSLTIRAADSAFSPGPMVMALLNGGERRAA